MATTITLTIFQDAESWLTENVPRMNCDSLACVRPTSQFEPSGLTTYEDVEADTEEGRGAAKLCDMADHVYALRLLCDKIGRTLFVGGLKSPFDLIDPGNWDVEVVDAFYQLVMLGEVIYG